MNAFVRKGFNKTDSRGIEKKKKKKMTSYYGRN